MTVFPNILTEKLSQDEYIASISDSEKQKKVIDLFKWSNKAIELDIANTNPSFEKPVIRIINSDEFIIQGIHGLIEFSDKFVNECLSAPVPPFQELITPLPSDQPIPKDFINTNFVWAIAHEYMHGLRRHNSVLEVVPDTTQTSHSFEIDADLCAAALFYRLAQMELQHQYSDITIRKIVLISLFWAIRGMPESASDATHPSNKERLFHVILKIAQLRANPNDPPDRDGSTEETRSNAAQLSESVARAEHLFRSMYLITDENFIVFFKTFMASSGWTGFTSSWEDIRIHVATISETWT